MEDISSIRNLRTLHVVISWGTLDMTKGVFEESMPIWTKEEG
jgi:hypothetical protein